MGFNLVYSVREDEAEYQRVNANIHIGMDVIDDLVEEVKDRLESEAMVLDTEVNFNTRTEEWEIGVTFESLTVELDYVMSTADLDDPTGVWEVADDPQIEIVGSDSDWDGAVSLDVTMMARRK